MVVINWRCWLWMSWLQFLQTWWWSLAMAMHDQNCTMCTPVDICLSFFSFFLSHYYSVKAIIHYLAVSHRLMLHKKQSLSKQMSSIYTYIYIYICIYGHLWSSPILATFDQPISCDTVFKKNNWCNKKPQTTLNQLTHTNLTDLTISVLLFMVQIVIVVQIKLNH